MPTGEREQAWRTYLERYRPLIVRWCHRAQLTHADAEEVSSAILARLVTIKLTFVSDPTRGFRAWLQSVVMNEVRTLWRQRRTRPFDQGMGNPDLHDPFEETESPPFMDELEEELDKTLGRDLELAHQVAARVQKRLKEHTWQAYWQTVMEGETADLVAQRLGISLAVVYQARKRVSQMLREEGVVVKRQAEHGGTGQP
jgi:RNA polymerase sigma-70 factor, ECF subfamily